MTTFFQRKRKPGFTLVELLVVISIIALLVAIVLPAINNALFRGKLTAAAANGRSIQQAMFAKETEAVYRTTSVTWPQTGDYTDSDAFFDSLVTNGTVNVAYSFFAAPGIPSAEDQADFLLGGKCAWNVVEEINDGTSETLPAIFTRNLDITTLTDAATLTADTDGTPTVVDGSLQPFGKKGFVFVTKSGAAFALFKDDMKADNFEALFNTESQGVDANNPILKTK